MTTFKVTQLRVVDIFLSKIRVATHSVVTKMTRSEQQNCRKSNSWLDLPRAAAVQCANMNPELRPPSLTRKAGSSLRAETIWGKLKMLFTQPRNITFIRKILVQKFVHTLF